MRDRRRELLAGARGRTVELGAGTGLNFAHYPEAVDELILTEPFPPMAGRLRERAGDAARGRVIEAPADRLPIPDGWADTVVCTLVLCTVDDVPATLRRGRARSSSPAGGCCSPSTCAPRTRSLTRWQDRFERPWKLFGHGCRCNRDTVAAIGGSPLEVEPVERGEPAQGGADRPAAGRSEARAGRAEAGRPGGRLAAERRTCEK